MKQRVLSFIWPVVCILILAPVPALSQNAGGGKQVVERILLMRHAEKPEDDSNRDLTPAGYKRADALAQYIPQVFGKPDFIFAAADSKNSSRPTETATPLSRATGVQIDTTFRDKDCEDLAEILMTSPQFEGKLVVIIWHHGKIPKFAHALNANEDVYGQEWPPSCFNKILEFDYVGKRHPVVTPITEPF